MKMNIKTSTLILTKQLKNLPRFFSSVQPVLLTTEIEDKVILTINRPDSLNAINPPLIKDLYKAFQTYETEKSLVIFKGAGDRAFSAGGDLINIRKSFKQNTFDESRSLIIGLNLILYLMHTYKIPIICFMNGITFGGGAGLASFSRYKIATEKTLFAMPESKIAFHPNSGATFFLGNAKRKLGYYLALTSDVLKGTDVLKAGFATHYCLNKNLNTLENALLKSTKNDNIQNIIDDICEKDSSLPELSLTPFLKDIEICFSEPTVERIISKLEDIETDWTKNVAENLKKLSPTSLKVILEQLQRGKNMSLEDSLYMESNLSSNFYKYNDVEEGVRTTLINRGDIPKWNPSRLEDVTDELIEDHFKEFQGNNQKELLNNIRK